MLASFHSVELSLPNGRILFQDLNFTLTPGKWGIVGPNGIGKSTLARLLSGELLPTAGQLIVPKPPLYFPQAETPPSITLGEYLIDIWSLASDHACGLRDEFVKDFDLTCPCSHLSGGAWTRARLLKALTESSGVMVLDEPTNNLDQEGRRAVQEFVALTDNHLILISHDRELLSKVERILELSNRGASLFEGNWESYTQAREIERNSLMRNAELARKEWLTTERERKRSLEIQAKRQASAARRAPHLGMPKIALGILKRRAENTEGRLDSLTRKKVILAQNEVRQASSELKFDPSIYAEFPVSAIPQSKLLMEAIDFNIRFDQKDCPLWEIPLTFSFSGPARVRIKGPNGSGKSTLLRFLTEQRDDQLIAQGSLRLGSVTWAYLKQEDFLPYPQCSVLEYFLKQIPQSPDLARNTLARFLFQKEQVYTKVEALSGGERLRLSLATAIAHDPAPQLIILDEPTNHLDIAGIEFLEEAIAGYLGAILVVTHDETFAERIGLRSEIALRPLNER